VTHASPQNPARRRLLAALLAAAFVGVLPFGLLRLVPFPPKSIVMTTGPEGGAYRGLGEEYRRALARDGIDLKVVASLGDVESLKRLDDSRSDVVAGFVSGGLTTAQASPGLASLGTISCEPLWIFCRGLPEPLQLSALRGRRVSIGPEGGGTRSLMLTRLRAEGLEDAVTQLPLTPGGGGEALLRGELDCAAMATAPEAPIVRKLLADESVGLVTFPRADAYVALYPYLRKVVVPQAVGNLAANRPPHDMTLLAPMSSLLVRQELHTAIRFLLLQAADRIHGGPGVLRRPGQFPAPEPVDVPLSSASRSFHKSGGNVFQRNLPFWLWARVSHWLHAPMLYTLKQHVALVGERFARGSR
jgi:TRAP-type uncharacterized transport system substrate-binding protein